MTGSLHLSVYGRDESFLGHLGFSKSADVQEWSSMPFCPSYSADEEEKHLSFSGTPGLTFTVRMTQQQDVKLNEPETVDLDQWHRVRVFQFIPSEDISKKQLDVTVTSDSDVPAYLKVSKNCKDVTEENIRLVDYKGESIRLSFAKKGRITLSKVSEPPLTDSLSSWFIGIALKNATGETKTDAKKAVTLTLTRSFDYSYASPLLILILVIGFVLGIGVTCCALCCFKKPHVSPKQFPSCMDKRGQRMLPLNAIDVDSKDVFNSIQEIICKYWFGGGPKTFSYITAIVGCVLLVGAFQFVVADWYLMIDEGDRDHCYYNDFCYRVGCHDLPLNLMISNVVYIVHAFILTLSVLWMEAELFARCKELANASADSGDEIFHDAENGNTSSVTGAKGEASSRNLKEDQREVEAQGVSAVREGSSPPPPKDSGSLSLHALTVTVQVTSQANLPPPGSSSVQATSQANPPPPGSSSVQVTSQANPPPPGSSSVQATSNGSATANNSERLPWHVLICPNISPHLTTMTVPMRRKMKPVDTARCRAEGYKRKFSFSIGYAFAWALLFEGLFSTLYHLCPSKMTFQFDTAFMFLIAGLIVVLQHNGIELEECSPEGEAKGHVGAANFFLGFIVPLYIFNYFGSLYHSEVGISLISFSISLLVWSILIAVWAAYRLFPNCSSEDKCKFGLFVVALILPIVLLSWLGTTGNFPLAFLLICISESGCVIVWRAIKKTKNLRDGCQRNCGSFCKVLKNTVKKLFCCLFTGDWLFIGQVLYILVFSVVMFTALGLFIGMPSTDKASTPERSRDLNHECVVGIFDYHDLWHILSSFALLMGAHLVMYISYDPPTKTKPGSNANQTRNYGTVKTTADQGQTARENRSFSQDSLTELNERRQSLHPPS